ncbi:MAG: transglutaminase family protein [Bryobacterales bacterium]|nr:transglutaminase family protein [Bryobacterales bacterium]
MAGSTALSPVLESLLATGDESIELDSIAIEIARFENPQLDGTACSTTLDEWASAVEARLSPSAGGSEFISKTNHHLFNKLQLRGDQESYFDPANSCLDQVIARRKGLPITLAVIYLEIARRLLRPAYGVALPAHFVVRYDDGLFSVYVDVFNRGQLLTQAQCEEMVRRVTASGTAAGPEVFAAATKRQIAVRMLRNLQNANLRAGNRARAVQIQHFLNRHLPTEIPFNSL